MILNLSSNTLPIIVRGCLFVLFSYVNGLLLSGVVRHVPSEQIKHVVKQTMMIFGSMVFIGVMFIKLDIDITPLEYASTLIIVIILSLGMYYVFLDSASKKTTKNIRTLIILLSYIYVAYDTYNILSKDYDDDIVNSTLDYYMGFYNIFSNSLDTTD
jgi:FtsH-binding integral membrane protein